MHIASSCAASCTLHDALQADLHFDIVASSRLGHAERRASTFRPGNDEHLHVTHQPQPEVRLAHAKATHTGGANAAPTRGRRTDVARVEIAVQEIMLEDHLERQPTAYVCRPMAQPNRLTRTNGGWARG